MFSGQLKKQAARLGRVVISTVWLFNPVTYISAVISVVIIAYPQVTAADFLTVIPQAYRKIIGRYISFFLIFFRCPVKPEINFIVV